MPTGTSLHPPHRGLQGTVAHVPWGPGARRVAWLPRSRARARVGSSPAVAWAARTAAPALALQAVVGDSEFHHFRYRIPAERVRLLEVGGDLLLESVKVF